MKRFLLLQLFLGLAFLNYAQEQIVHSSTDTLFVSDKCVQRILITNSCVAVIGDNVRFDGSNDWRFGFNKAKGTFKLVADSISLPPTDTRSISAIQTKSKMIFDLNYLSSPIIEDATPDNSLVIQVNKGVLNIDIIEADSLIIENASVKSTTFDVNTIVDNNNTPVYQVQLPHNNNKNFIVQKDNGSGFENYHEYSFSYFHKDATGNNDPAYYIYLPDGNYSVTTGAETYTFTVDGEAVNVAIKPAIAGNGIVDLSGGEFFFTDEGYQVGNQPFTYDGANGYTFTGTTTGTLTIPADFAFDTITLSKLSIDRSQASTNEKAITIEKPGDFEVVLDGSSSFIGNSNGNGKIAYNGNGALAISGTSANNSDTLYLARFSSVNAPKLVVKSGTVFNNAGGAVSSGDSLLIEGGVVACYYIGSATIVNGGTFTKYNEYATGLFAGGENRTTVGAIGEITFNGGTSYIQLWNAEYPGLDENVKINGGSVCIENPCTATSGNFDGTYRFASNDSPTRADGTERIYQSIYKLPVPTGTAIDSIKTEGVVYPGNDVYTDTASSVYLWLPETGDAGEDPVTNVSIFIGGTEFKFRGYVDTQFEYVPYTDDMNPGQGNKQEIIPLVSLATTNGSFALSGDYALEYNSNWYACSGSEVSIAATPDAGYELDSMAVNGTKLAGGETAFTVVRPDQPVTQIEVSVGFKEAVRPLVKITTTNGSFDFSGTGVATQGSEQTGKVGSEVTITITPDIGYELDTIAVNGVKLTDGVTSFTVDGSATQMEVSVGFVSVSTAINATERSNIKVFGVQNAINIQGAGRASVQVINLSGIKVYEAQNVSSDYIPVKQGIYIVVVNNKSYKVMVR